MARNSRTRRRVVRWGMIGLSGLFFGRCPPAWASIFSVDRFSPSAGAADLLVPGPFVHVSAANLGLVHDDDLDAVSGGQDIVTRNDILHFSVRRDSQGVPGTAVRNEYLKGEQPSDLFVTVTLPVNGEGVMCPPEGDNALDINQNRFGLTPYSDNLDAFSFEEFDFNGDQFQDVNVYFSLDAASPSYAGVKSGANIYLAPAGHSGFYVYRDYESMGLEVSDDIDAVALNTGIAGPARAYFSLANRNRADIYYTEFNGSSEMIYSAGELGLLATDDVDALETNAIPEPSCLLVLSPVGGWLCLRRRRAQ